MKTLDSALENLRNRGKNTAYRPIDEEIFDMLDACFAEIAMLKRIIHKLKTKGEDE